jgi:hypothetical protein
MRAVTLLTVLAVMAAALPIAAQEQEPGLVAKVLRISVEPAQVLRFEQALREHLALHERAADSWAWHAWQVVNGQDHGQYLLRSHGHRWQDFDDHAAASDLDAADFVAHVAPYARSITSTLEVVEPAISSWSRDAARPNLVELVTYSIRFDGSRDFLHVVDKVHRAATQVRPGVQYVWSTTVNGSNGPTMTLAIPHTSWAELDRRANQVWDALREVYGEAEAELLRRLLAASIADQRSSILRYREDLSYQPGG